MPTSEEGIKAIQYINKENGIFISYKDALKKWVSFTQEEKENTIVLAVHFGLKRI